jgi:hypothetical protein
MSKPEHFAKYLGNEKYYHDFLLFFQQELEKKGWQDVLKEYLFAGNARADDFLGRLFAGRVYPNHPKITPLISEKDFFTH